MQLIDLNWKIKCFLDADFLLQFIVFLSSYFRFRTKQILNWFSLVQKGNHFVSNCLSNNKKDPNSELNLFNRIKLLDDVTTFNEDRWACNRNGQINYQKNVKPF